MRADTDSASYLTRLRLVRDELDARCGMSSGAWRRLSISLRAYLVTECTCSSRPLEWAQQTWADFSDEERIRIGAVAREWRRALQSADALR